MPRILITGSRGWTDALQIDEAIDDWIRKNVPENEITTIVHGDCPTGADRLAKEYVKFAWWVKEEAHPADWNTHGRRAGFVRNAEMVKLGADVCLAFIYKGSKGATHTADLAEKAGIPTRRYEVQ